MVHIGSENPWLAMWSEPRTTISALVQKRPTYGVFYLATIYILQNFFFYFNWWSLGLSSYYGIILFTCVVLSPLVGFLWLYYLGFIYYLMGRCLKGRAPAIHLRTAIAWSNIPYSISLIMWFVLILMDPENSFVHDPGAQSFVFINLISFILEVWAFVLLVQAIREVQQFSALRSIANVALSSSVSAVFLFLVFSAFRYFFIS
ncbi:MAG: hypothetical protein COT85_01950 [Chlamydiae bacterium CG10_big_fil_rev_8_21_14_0_10_42_34]|nr:MAG: hypothetical protein COT85_01950 [Chlamydiae bacterium CG10_big_fil_rev_8_21_14_0_10_42_34]